MSQRIALMLGVLLIAGGLLGASFTWSTIGEVSAQDDPGAQEHAGNPGSTDDGERSQAHEQMHKMMDAMMGEGFTERMHAAMPGSEAMMEACSNGMGNMMDGMMQDGDMMPDGGMMDGMQMDGMSAER